jgi:hypothetical protein
MTADKTNNRQRLMQDTMAIDLSGFIDALAARLFYTQRAAVKA